MKYEKEYSFLIAGTVRNCENTLRHDAMRLYNSIGEIASKIQWFIVESDSEDGTIDVLKSLEEDLDGFRWETCGRLSEKIPNRTARIGFCRNRAIEFLEKDDFPESVDYLVVSDFDGVNDKIDSDSFATCWSNGEDWDMCSANQDGPYYDIFALRHPLWSPNDCFAQREFLLNFERNWLRAQDAAVNFKMIAIPPQSRWIEVDSAFGGLAVYRADAVRGHRYDGGDANGSEICEHIAMHASMRKSGAKLFINPGLINADYTEHSKRLKLPRRIASHIRNFLRRLKQAIDPDRREH